MLFCEDMQSEASEFKPLKASDSMVENKCGLDWDRLSVVSLLRPKKAFGTMFFMLLDFKLKVLAFLKSINALALTTEKPMLKRLMFSKLYSLEKSTLITELCGMVCLISRSKNHSFRCSSVSSAVVWFLTSTASPGLVSFNFLN